MNDPAFSDKFIAFVDILGFESMVRAAEAGHGRPLADILNALNDLGRQSDRDLVKAGPVICPEADRIHTDMDFQITRCSDSLVVSAEVSPAGVIAVVNHCWKASFRLLKRGILCRGYVTRGKIYHTKDDLLGTGFMDAMSREKHVSVFNQHADEHGTPFIEVDAAVTDYVRLTTDARVKEVYWHMVKADGDLVAIFPFQRLGSFAVGVLGGGTLDPESEKASVRNVRKWITDMKEKILAHAGDRSNDSAVRRKIEQYLRMLDAQLVICDQTYADIDFLSGPFPGTEAT